MSIEILDCLKRKQDICIKNIIPSQNTAFGFTPALSELRPISHGIFLTNFAVDEIRTNDLSDTGAAFKPLNYLELMYPLRVNKSLDLVKATKA